MANIFQRSFDELAQWLRSPQGRVLEAGEPAPTPYVNPGQSQPQSRGTTGTWNPPVPAFAGGTVTPTMQPTGNVSGNVTANMPPVIPWPSMTPTGQVTGTPTGAFSAGQSPAMQPTGNVTGAPTGVFPAGQSPTMQPTGNVTGAPTGPFNAAPEKVTTKIDRPTHSETHSIQAKPPKQTEGADYRNVVDPDARYLHAAAAAQGGGAPAGPAPAVPTAPAVRPAQPASQATGPWSYGAPPSQGQGQNVNLQVPAHPGLLERIGQTISHFFGGTLGQHQQPQQPASPYRPGYGPPEGNALSGVSRALASGRQHVATHGGSAPASAAAWTPNLASTEPQPLEDTDVGITPEGQAYRADITNPLAYRTPLTPPAGATQMITDPKTGQKHWADKDKKIIQ